MRYNKEEIWKLYKIDHHVSYLRLLIGVGIVVSQVIVMVMIINKLQRKQSGRVSRLTAKIGSTIYYEPLKTFGVILLQNKVVAMFTNLSATILEHIIWNKTSAYFFTIYFYLLPKLILVIFLWADIILLSQIYAFYKMLWLFGVIIIVQGVVGLINIYTTNLKAELEDIYLSRELSTSEQIVLNTRDPIVEKEWIQYHNILDIIKSVNLVTISKLYLILNLFITTLL